MAVSVPQVVPEDGIRRYSLLLSGNYTAGGTTMLVPGGVSIKHVLSIDHDSATKWVVYWTRALNVITYSIFANNAGSWEEIGVVSMTGVTLTMTYIEGVAE